MGNLSTPTSVQKLQMALHAKAKAEAGYRFYVLYDKISREDILAHAYAQCRSNKGAPGVDGQEFAVGFRDVHSSDRVRSVALLPERKRQFAKPPLQPMRLDVRKILTVHTRRALVGAALGIGMPQDVIAADLIIRGVEAIAGLCLRFRV